jgi:seryl-tRNA synthetase
MTDPPNDRSTLLAAELLVGGGVDGVYHRSFAFEHVVRGVEAYVSAAGSGESDRHLFLAPVQARTTLEKSGYVSSFPNLIGAISGIPDGSARAAIADPTGWISLLEATEVSLCSAACHGLYPLLAGDLVAPEGARYEIQCWVFRHEPSSDPARMQSFRQHEFVYVGTADGALEHRDRWLARGHEILTELGLDVAAEVANDPFFGRAAPMLAESQREKELKFELVALVASEDPRAIASANYHEDHFGEAFDIRLAEGGPAHTACIGFGLERISLALLRRHGLRIELWPNALRDRIFANDPNDAWTEAT